MPRGDRTGPAGMGPMTGRAAGYCAGYSTPGYMNPYGGRVSAGAPFWGAGSYAGRYPYNAADGGWGAYPAYGAFRTRGRFSGFGLGRGRGGLGRGSYGRGRGRW
jgi:hypothetical protein